MSRNTKRKILSICLSIAMVLSMLPVNNISAKAANTIENNVTIKGDEAVAGSGTSITPEVTTGPAIMTEENQTLANAIVKEWHNAEFEAAGIDPTTLMTIGSVTAYVKITKCTPYSRVRFSAGGTSGGHSNKELAGVSHSMASSGYIIHSGSGDGKGAAGTGIYKFPGSNTNKYKSTEEEISIKLTTYTANTEAQLIGVVFGDVLSVSFDEDGNISEGFNPSDYTLESTTADSTDPVPDQGEEEEGVTSRDKLKMRLDYAATMDSTKYQTASWEAFQTELASAKAVYDNAASTEAQCDAARASLEKVKTGMLFVNSTDAGNPMPFRQLSKDEVMEEMGVGINLGNTLDGHSGFTPSETAWQSVTTTKEIIKSMHDAGYNTVRIPVTWGNMIDPKNGYAINSNWITRVQEIVDYCVSQDMYAIINIHHDGAEQSGWLRVAADEIDVVYEEFEQVWRHIAEYFKDYDEHLIFESMNEITCMEGNNKNSAEAVDKDTPIIVNMNQLFVNTVRATGSNNSKRYLAAVAHYANSGNHKAFKMPADAYNETPALMFAAHIYKANTNVTWTYSEVYQVVDGLKNMHNKFAKNYPMYLGEYGVRTQEQAGTESGYNEVARAYFSEIVHRACQKAEVVPVVWDQSCGTKGIYETGLFHYWDRAGLKPLFKEITDAMMRGTMLPISEKNQNWDFTDVEEGVTVTEMTEMTPSATDVTLAPGERTTLTVETAPADSNDIVLWSTDDDSVATVYNGLIHAKGIGKTTIHVYTQSGSVTKDISVSVSAVKDENAVTEIVTDKDSYTIELGSYQSLQTSVLPETATKSLTYKSSNPSVVAINAAGKMIAVAEGKALITITAASGVTKTVTVTVENPIKKDEVKLALHVLYNDTALGYYGTEIGEYIIVKEDGTYTVEFDLAKDISDAGKAAGITALKNLTSVYIKDYDVMMGKITSSNVSKIRVKYESVVVNGTTNLTMTTAASKDKSALRGSVVDTGGPLNGYDGNYVKEVTTSNNIVNFSQSEPVTKIAVTFTLSKMTWKADEVVSVPATAITSDSAAIEMSEIGETVDIAANVAPADTTALVSFVSSDRSVVDVDSTAKAPVDGVATAQLKATGYGTATVTAYTDDGLSFAYNVTVTDPNAPVPTEPAATEPAPTEPAATEPAATEPAAPAPSAPAAGGTATPPSILTTTVPVQAPVKGDVVTAGDASYVVADAEAKTVEYKAPAKKNVTSVTVPATIELSDNGQMVKYQVTGIAKNAFAKNKKLKSVVIGKNVTKIGANAFKDCKSLKKITIKSKKLKSIGKNAIKNINKKAVIKVPKAKLKAYKKLFKKSTGYKKTMKIKKA